MGKTNELRLTVPAELKTALVNLAKIQQTSVNALGILLINRLLNRQPNLLTILNSAIVNMQKEQKLLPQYHSTMSKYAVMMQNYHDHDRKNYEAFIKSCEAFIQEAAKFIEQFCQQNSKGEGD